MAKVKNFFALVLFLSCCFGGNVTGAVAVPDYGQEQTFTQADRVAECYTSQIGVTELTGNNDGREVEMYLASTGLGKGHPWCAAFVSWCFKEAGVKAPRSAWSPSWFPKGNTVYTRGVTDHFSPQRADVFGIWYTNLKRVGHVGFIDEPGADFCITVEGNTNTAGSREGDGVYRKRRVSRQIYQLARYTA